MGIASVESLINDVKQSLTNNDQCYNKDGMWKTRKISCSEAEAKAELLVRKLSAPQCRKFFLKCIYHLPEAEIQNALEVSMKPQIYSPVRYFNKVCKTKLAKRGL